MSNIGYFYWIDLVDYSDNYAKVFGNGTLVLVKIINNPNQNEYHYSISTAVIEQYPGVVETRDATREHFESGLEKALRGISMDWQALKV